jgi:septin family protein
MENNFIFTSNNKKIMTTETIEKRLYREATTRNILIIGRTGNGKSALANVITNSDKFKEGEFGSSKTKINQVESFCEVINENNITFRIIDTIGIGDTNLSIERVLESIADAAHKVKDGLHQILFVCPGRFTDVEKEVYNLLRKVMFDKEITNYTTIVRTRFPNFRKLEKCLEDRELMMKENKEMAEIIRQLPRMIHVDNPTLNVEDEDEIALNTKKRKLSREQLMRQLYLFNAPYKPDNLNAINARVGEYMTEKERLEKELNEMKKISEEQRKEMEQKIDELKNEAAKQVEQILSQKKVGLFQKTGLLIDGGIEKVGESTAIVYQNFSERCKIM